MNGLDEDVLQELVPVIRMNKGDGFAAWAEKHFAGPSPLPMNVAVDVAFAGARNGADTVVERVVRGVEGFPLFARTGGGETLLHVGARLQYFRVVRVLLRVAEERGDPSVLSAVDHEGMTPRMAAQGTGRGEGKPWAPRSGPHARALLKTAEEECPKWGQVEKWNFISHVLGDRGVSSLLWVVGTLFLALAIGLVLQGHRGMGVYAQNVVLDACYRLDRGEDLVDVWGMFVYVGGRRGGGGDDVVHANTVFKLYHAQAVGWGGSGCRLVEGGGGGGYWVWDGLI